MTEPSPSARDDEDADMVTWTCYQWPRQCGHHDDVDCFATEEAIKQRLQTFEVPDA